MSFSSKDEFEFTVTAAERENVRGSETKIKRIILHTEDVPKDKITIKPTKDKETTDEHGIPTTIPDADHYSIDELPDNVLNVLKKAQEMDELDCVATVTRPDNVDEDEEPNFFINDYHMETLEVRLIQDDRGSEDE